MPIYDLKSVFDTAQLLEQDYAKKMHFSKKEKNGLYLLRYIKDFLRPDNIAALGLLSVIITKDKLFFSPPKQCVDFTQKYGLHMIISGTFLQGAVLSSIMIVF